jgi:hypothetical protein
MERGNKRPGAVIVGGHFLSLGAARNLAKHGVPVYILDSGVCVAQFSRHVRRFFKGPPTSDEAGFVDFLLQLAVKANLGGCVLFPSNDECVRIFAQHRERLSEHYLVTTPPWDVVKFVYDKRLTCHLAKEREIPIAEPVEGWDGVYHQLGTKALHVPAEPRPFVGLPADAPRHVVSFLREQGYILGTGETATRCGTYIDAATLARLTSEVELVKTIEASAGPLVRYWRWPGGARSVMCVTGDLDALTLLDYASRLFVR